MSSTTKLQAKIVRGELVIRIGIEELANIAEESAWKPVVITCPSLFANDCLFEIQKTINDADSPLREMLNRVTASAFYNGADGIRWRTEEDKEESC